MSQALRVIHDYWGAVAPIRGRGARARHVWQHLYNQVELWDALIGRAVEPLVLESIRMGCPAPQPGDANHRPRLSLVSDRCLSVLHRHHQKHYSPAYMEQLGQPNTRWARQRIREDRLLCCTPRGVLVSVGLRPPVSVVTAL